MTKGGPRATRSAVPKMHADEVATSVGLARQLLETQFPEWAALPIEPVVPAGTDNALYRVGSDMVMRLPRREKNARQLEEERRWLPRLAPLLPLPSPIPLVDGKPSGSYPFEWSVYSWVEGEPATTSRLADLGQVAIDLADFIAALQRVDPTGAPPPGESNAFRGVPLAQRDTATRAAIASLRGEIDLDEVSGAWVQALWAHEWQGPPVWIHGDLDARNLLVKDGRLSGVIDFGCLGIGDPACDVMVAWKILPAEARDTFRTALSVDEATWARSRGWALSQALMALSYYTSETNPVLVREARHWMDQVLTDRRH